MALKIDAVSEGFHGAIYDNNDNSRSLVWRCLCTPAHNTKAEAKACAKNRLEKLKRKGKG